MAVKCGTEVDSLKGSGYIFREATLSKSILSFSEKGSTLKGKNLLPLQKRTCAGMLKEGHKGCFPY